MSVGQKGRCLLLTKTAHKGVERLICLLSAVHLFSPLLLLLLLNIVPVAFPRFRDERLHQQDPGKEVRMSDGGVRIDRSEKRGGGGG